MKLQRQSSDADEDPIRYRTDGQVSRRRIIGHTCPLRVSPTAISASYTRTALLIFVAAAAIRETVRGDSDLLLLLLLLEAESGSIRSRSDHGACVACGVHPRSAIRLPQVRGRATTDRTIAFRTVHSALRHSSIASLSESV